MGELLELRLCRECAKRVATLGGAHCARCSDYIDSRIADGRRHATRAAIIAEHAGDASYCVDCWLVVRPEDSAAIVDGFLYHRQCAPSSAFERGAEGGERG